MELSSAAHQQTYLPRLSFHLQFEGDFFATGAEITASLSHSTFLPKMPHFGGLWGWVGSGYDHIVPPS
jgi:hypothetical protein